MTILETMWEIGVYIVGGLTMAVVGVLAALLFVIILPFRLIWCAFNHLEKWAGERLEEKEHRA